MNRYSLESIEPLIVAIQEQGRSLQIVFQCPSHGRRSLVKPPLHTTTQQAASSKVRKDLMYGAQRVLSRVIRDVFGHSTLGPMASDITSKLSPMYRPQ